MAQMLVKVIITARAVDPINTAKINGRAADSTFPPSSRRITPDAEDPVLNRASFSAAKDGRERPVPARRTSSPKETAKSFRSPLRP